MTRCIKEVHLENIMAFIAIWRDMNTVCILTTSKLKLDSEGQQ